MPHLCGVLRLGGGEVQEGRCSMCVVWEGPQFEENWVLVLSPEQNLQVSVCGIGMMLLPRY